MKTWWLQRSARERLFLLLAIISLLLFVLYQNIWAPWQEHLAYLKHQVQQDTELLHWMQETQQRYQQFKARDSKQPRQKVTQLLNTLTTSLKQQNLHTYLSHFEQLSDKKVKLTFTAVSFNSLLAWLTKLQQETDIKSEQIILNATTKSGEVQANLVLVL